MSEQNESYILNPVTEDIVRNMSEFDPTLFETITGFSAEEAYDTGFCVIVELGKRNPNWQKIPGAFMHPGASLAIAMHHAYKAANPELTADSRAVIVRNLGLMVLTEQS